MIMRVNRLIICFASIWIMDTQYDWNRIKFPVLYMRFISIKYKVFIMFL